MSATKITIWIFAVALAWVCGLPGTATATPEFSSRTEQGCLTCHRDEQGGGALTTIGLRFGAPPLARRHPHQARRRQRHDLPRAPHDAKLLERAQRVGTFDPTQRPKLTGVQKAFSIVAYVNLGLVFAVLTLLAVWRWGL
ncbi:MAG: hypothetical protein ACYC9Y_03925 [Candidatus Methylomirabilia bacterium]